MHHLARVRVAPRPVRARRAPQTRRDAPRPAQRVASRLAMRWHAWPGRRRRRRRRALPAAEPARSAVELRGLGGANHVWRVVPLPGGGRVATAATDSRLRVYDVATGALRREMAADTGGAQALCALGGDVLASGGGGDGRLVTWDAASGARLCEATAGRSAADAVHALTALGDARFAAGTRGGYVVLYAHSAGRDVVETARLFEAHSLCISDLATCEGRLGTASFDKTAAVWDVASRERLATLRGHSKGVRAVDMNRRVVVTASEDHTVRVFSVADDYKCSAVLDWLHHSSVRYVELIGDDVIASADWDATVCVTRVSTNAVIARADVNHHVWSAAVLANGHLAVGCVERAELVAPPPAAADAFKAHGAAAFPDAAATRALTVAEPLPPLQSAVARVAAGELSAAAACRDLITPDACSASLEEWRAAHVLLMRAVQDGGIARGTGHGGKRNWWFLCVYAQARTLAMGEEDRVHVLNCINEACDAGLLEGTEGTVATLVARTDLEEAVTNWRSAGEKILHAVGELFLSQAETDRRLTQHMVEFKCFRDVQRVSQLLSAIFSLVPFAGAALASGAEVATVAFANMETTNVLESVLGICTGSHAFASEPLLDKFLHGARNVLDETVYRAMPEESRESLIRAIAGMKMTVDDLRAIVSGALEDESHVEDAEGVDVENVQMLEDATGVSESQIVEGIAPVDDAMEFGAVQMVNLRDRAIAAFEPKGDRAEDSDTAKPASDCAQCPCDKRKEEADELYFQGDSQIVANPVSDDRDCKRCQADRAGEVSRSSAKADLQTLEKMRITARAVAAMKSAQLASTLAAYMVGYDHDMAEQFAQIRESLTEAFQKKRVYGRRIIGKFALPQDSLCNIVLDALSESRCGASDETDVLSVRAFYDELGKA